MDQVACPGCRKRLLVADGSAARDCQCPACGAVFNLEEAGYRPVELRPPPAREEPAPAWPGAPDAEPAYPDVHDRRSRFPTGVRAASVGWLLLALWLYQFSGWHDPTPSEVVVSWFGLLCVGVAWYFASGDRPPGPEEGP